MGGRQTIDCGGAFIPVGFADGWCEPDFTVHVPREKESVSRKSRS
jgi:hypothetical protein